MPNILIVNGSIQGNQGNTQTMILRLRKELQAIHSEIMIDTWELSNSQDFSEKFVRQKFISCDAVVFCAGTYWDSWGHLLQKLLEEMTFLEGKSEILGKPAGVLVSMHSVGGKEVCSRLQGVLATMGFLIPPMSHMVYSLANHLALRSESEFAEDFWSLQDLQVVAKNLVAATKSGAEYTSWVVDEKDPRRKWLT